MSKVGRNDPCPCGSGKKYKSCCAQQERPGIKRKFKATILSHGGQSKQTGNDLIERAFTQSLAKETAPFKPVSSDAFSEPPPDMPRPTEKKD